MKSWDFGKTIQLNLLIDTHVIIWFLIDASELRQKQHDVLEDGENRIFVSAASLFEITNKIRIEKLVLPDRYMRSAVSLLADFDFTPLNISPGHAALAGQLAAEHKDPFDRFLAAQSIVENLPIMSIDQRIADLGAKVIW